MRLVQAGAEASGVSVGGRLSCSRSELASFTGERLDRKDLDCSAASRAFFLAAFFSSCWSRRLSLRGFGSVGGGERWWRVGAGWTEDETVINIVISWKEAQSLGYTWAHPWANASWGASWECLIVFQIPAINTLTRCCVQQGSHKLRVSLEAKSILALISAGRRASLRKAGLKKLSLSGGKVPCHNASSGVSLLWQPPLFALISL